MRWSLAPLLPLLVAGCTTTTPGTLVLLVADDLLAIHGEEGS